MHWNDSSVSPAISSPRLHSVLSLTSLLSSAASLTQTVDGVVTKRASYAAAVGMFLFLAAFSGFWLVPSWIYGAEITP